jgi:two-component system, NtrC family, nitrogen regulation sensor histidine kinase NtrY
MPKSLRQPRRAFLIFLLVFVPALLFLGWSQASLDLSFISPSTALGTILLVIVSTVVFVAFVIFALILVRILLKLYVERRQQQLGSRFKTKMVVSFLLISLVPVCFLFVFAYGLLNRSIDRWFTAPFDTVRRDANEIVQELALQTEQRALDDSGHLLGSGELHSQLFRQNGTALRLLLARQLADPGLYALMCFGTDGQLLARVGASSPGLSDVFGLFPGIASGQVPTNGITARWLSPDLDLFLAARGVQSEVGARLGTIVIARRLPLPIKQIADRIQKSTQRYDELNRDRRALRRTYVSVLSLLTLLLLFVATWFAMFLSKQVTVPVQALAEATNAVSSGNLGFQITARTDDELGSLIRLFNQMTLQLQESRRVIEDAAQGLQRANRELEEHSNTMEAILENIPVGVISFNRQGQITRVNSTAERLFGPAEMTARNLSELVSPEDAREITRMFRPATRQGVVTRQMQLGLGGRRTAVALTLSSIRARHSTVGFVLVLEDLTELLRAQKAAAWREVAQRIAHEIKNPLTPIQLSVERIERLLARSGANPPGPEVYAAIIESASLIGRELTALKTLVDEFSAFARFPTSQPVSFSVNTIVGNALDVFNGQLDGIHVHRALRSDLPSVQADPEQLKRAIVNLIDNAAEALQRSPAKEIWVSTDLDPEQEVIEIVVADSGPGIAAEDKEKLFLPFFSTKQRGTGLGLAIVSRIISEHNGLIRVEENRPSGTRFVIELPVERAALNSEL